MIIYFHNYFEILSLLVCLFYINKLKNSFFALFLPYLAFIVAGELFGDNFWLTSSQNNVLYTFICVVSYFFYSYIFYRLVGDNRLFKKIVYALGFIFIGVTAALILLVEIKIVTYIVLYSSIALTLFSCIYFYNIMKTDDTSDDRTYIPGLWVAAGVLVFYVGVIICFSMINYIVANNLSVGGVKLHQFIPRCLSVILYSCFAIAFIVWKEPKKMS